MSKARYTGEVSVKTLGFYKVIDRKVKRSMPLVLLLLLVLLLRLPNFAEPYWYGDEGIYLTIGQALNKGYGLYSEIIDHKTPLIYVLAQVGTQTNFRLLLVLWMLATTKFFYFFALKLFENKQAPAIISTILFILLTTLPWFEGNIPNGELFVLGFVLLGAILLTKTAYFSSLLNTKKETKFSKKESVFLLAAGASLGLGILTKVPALFDAGALMTAGFFAVTNKFTFIPRKTEWVKALQNTLLRWGLLTAGIALPIIASVLYFTAKGTAADYLQFGLLYNFHYAGSWGLPFESKLLQMLFTLPGKFALTAGIILLLTFLRKHVRPIYQFLGAWFVLALFASLLSNRPYPHYFIQVIPPLVLLTGQAAADFMSIKGKLPQALMRTKHLQTLLIPLGAIGLFSAVLILLNVGLYPVKSYYSNWWQFFSGAISREEHRQSFNYLMKDNYSAAAIIKTAGSDRLFIWGTNPMLYALSGATPTGRFTVSFHIKDLDAFDETFEDFVAVSPEFVVVMNNEKDPFPNFYTYLHNNYRPYKNLDNFILWRRI